MPPLSSKSVVPFWITIKSYPLTQNQLNFFEHPENLNLRGCDQNCLYEGLLFGETLGEASKNGYDVVFLNQNSYAIKTGKSLISPRSVINHTPTKTLKYYTMNLFKKLVGNKVFSTKVSKNSANSKQTSFHAFCSKQMNGAMVILGINYANFRTKYNLKFTSPASPNMKILQYVLTVNDGEIMLNNDKISKEFSPTYKFKKSTKNSVILELPPFSIAFWEFKNAKIMECLNFEDQEIENIKHIQKHESSSDQLLEHLLKDVFHGKNDRALDPNTLNLDADQHVDSQETKKVRKHRVTRQLPKFELPKFELPLLPSFSSLNYPSLHHKSLKDLLAGKDTYSDTYKQNAMEKELLKSSENTALPHGDVYMLVGDGHKEQTMLEPSNDYVLDDTKELQITEPKQEHRSKPKKSKNMAPRKMKKISSTADYDYFIPEDYIESFRQSKKQQKKKPVEPVDSYFAETRERELWEIEPPSSRLPLSHDEQDEYVQSASNNVELTMITKELEPTVHQNKAAVYKAQKKLDKYFVMDMLKDAGLTDYEVEQDGDDGEYEVVELSGEFPPGEEVETIYEDEKDGDDFFNNSGEVDQDAKRVRQRREAFYTSKNLIKNLDLTKDEYRTDVDNYLDNEDVIEDIYSLKFPSKNLPAKVTTVLATTKDGSSEEFRELIPDLHTNSLNIHDVTNSSEENPSKTIEAVDYLSDSLEAMVRLMHNHFVGWWRIFTKDQEPTTF